MNRLQRRLLIPSQARPTPLGATEPVRVAFVARQGRQLRGSTLRSDGRPLPRRSSFTDLRSERAGAAPIAPIVARRDCAGGHC